MTPAHAWRSVVRVLALEYAAAPPVVRAGLTLVACVGLLAGRAVADSGPVVGWGENLYGQVVPPPSVDGTDGTASAIAAHWVNSCAIQSGTGAVVCWGSTPLPPPSVDGTDGAASAIALGRTHYCAIQVGTNAVVCWGNNHAPNGPRYTGQATPPPAVNGTAGTAAAIAVGDYHSCAIQAGTNAVVCWGYNRSPESPYNQTGQATPPPAVNGTAGTATAISAGGYHNCAIQAGSGAVVCWGLDQYADTTPPPSVDGTAGTATAITAGGYHSCAIQAGTGAVICWGINAYGLTTPPSSVDGTAGTATAIDGGWLHSCAIQSGTDAVVCWGYNYYGQATPPPSVNGTAGTALAIAANSSATFAIRVAECSDGLNNDHDGLVDFPADPGCDSETDVRETNPALDCDDGLDNDGDRNVDHPADPGCDSPTDSSEKSPVLVCDDDFDNDGDGRVDYPNDTGCNSPTDVSEQSAALVCDDGLDNDVDGLTDFPADPGCTFWWSDSERGECQDGIDNDFDGFTDYPADLDCRSLADGIEETDVDSDGVAPPEDNCATVFNPSQLDSNFDGYGNSCDADYDNDGVVGVSDFRMLRRSLGATTGSKNYSELLDSDGDGTIGFPEFDLLRSTFGNPPGPSGLPCAATGGCYCHYYWNYCGGF